MIRNELLKPNEMVNTKSYQQKWTDSIRSLLEKKPRKGPNRKRKHKVIFLYDNTPLYTEEPIRDTLKEPNWEVLPHAAYSSDLGPSNYHLFSLAEQRFGSYEDVKKWLEEWFATKTEEFYKRDIHKLPEILEKCITSDGAHLE